MKRKRRIFLREWRNHRQKTLEQAAEFVGMTHGNLSKIERGIQPYNEDLLERLAEYYMCDMVDLLIRDPTDPDGIWSLWERADTGKRKQIVAITKTILTTGTDS